MLYSADPVTTNPSAQTLPDDPQHLARGQLGRAVNTDNAPALTPGRSESDGTLAPQVPSGRREVPNARAHLAAGELSDASV